jgi:hypothetical protein
MSQRDSTRVKGSEALLFREGDKDTEATLK